MNKTFEEIAADILIAALESKAIHPNSVRQEENAKNVGEAYRIIFEHIAEPRTPPSPTRR